MCLVPRQQGRTLPGHVGGREALQHHWGIVYPAVAPKLGFADLFYDSIAILYVALILSDYNPSVLWTSNLQIFLHRREITQNMAFPWELMVRL